MNRKKTLIYVSIIVIVVAIAYAVVRPNWSNTTDQTASQTASAKTEQASPTEVSYVAKPGISSLDQLKTVARSLATQHSDYGEYVDAMEGHKGGDAGNYWSFYIDGELSSVGADSYIQKGGEKIVWKFQKL